MIVRSELKNIWLALIKVKTEPTQTAQKQKAMINHRLLK
ncbi:MAG: hypothetical protein ACI8QG_000288 [Flavobacteriales bacterium]|jgi:hypothetical protein